MLTSSIQVILHVKSPLVLQICHCFILLYYNISIRLAYETLPNPIGKCTRQFLDNTQGSQYL